ncbi:MAG: DUF4339 domain-containing protein [Limisphaerales bacterium]|jgi:hypothetical protein
MYFIVGSDNQHHGPINVDTLNQWIAQGRANGQTMTRLDGSQEWKPLATFSEFTTALAHAPLATGSAQGDATGGIIPYKNVPALTGYYMSVAGLLLMCVPVIGALFGIAVLTMGIKGLKKVKAQPEVKGTVHAWIAVVGGSIETIVGILTTIGMIGSMM